MKKKIDLRSEGHEERMRRYDETVAALQGKMIVGRKLTREEMNERRPQPPPPAVR